MTSGLKPGLTGETSFVVGENHLASAVGSGLVNVFSTAMMIAGMEEAAVKSVQPFLDKGITTVGVHVDITHKAATPAGLKVFFKATLLENSPNGKKLTFHIEARDERELIGEGAHERIIVDQKKFELKTALKKPKNV